MIEAHALQGIRGRLVQLPAELIQNILGFLTPLDLVHVGSVCHSLYHQTLSETLWSSHVHKSTHRLLPTSSRYHSYRQLYSAHFPYWFLTRHKIWFSDTFSTGKLIVCRYSAGRDCIEGYSLVAQRSIVPTTQRWEWDPQVFIDEFEPSVRLDLDGPVVRLEADALSQAGPPKRMSANRDGTDRTNDALDETAEQLVGRLALEVPMKVFVQHDILTARERGSLHSHFMFTRLLPKQLVQPGTALWPPLIVPSPVPGGAEHVEHNDASCGSRMRNASVQKFRGSGHKPSGWRDMNEAGFRLRRWMQLHDFEGLISAMSPANGHSQIHIASTVGGGFTTRIGEDVTSYGTIDEASYTPTPRKPWRGIWVGDYSTHGCEFLLLLQPEDKELQYGARPLPDKAARLIDAMNMRERIKRRQEQESKKLRESDLEQHILAWPTNVHTATLPTFGNHSRKLLAEDAALAMGIHGIEEEELLNPDQDPLAEMPHGEVPPISSLTNQDDENAHSEVYNGRIEAIKLTGDPNVPRGEYSFIAPEVGPGGLVRVAEEEIFRGARIVRSVGHIAAHGFKEDGYTESQLILVSHDTLAQYWKAFSHISFYKRVDIDQFLDAD